MDKILDSGITVDSEIYYQLLEWKDHNLLKFQWWLHEYGYNIDTGINDLSLAHYKALLMFANLD
jgi:hypothetical protein